MKFKFLAFIFLFLACKSTQDITHPLLRTDGFYYRQKKGDVYHYIRFFTNGRAVVSRRATKPEAFQLMPDRLMRNVDTSISFLGDTKKCSYKIRNDSVFFIKKPDNAITECYDTRYDFKVFGDSLVGTIEAINFDSTMLKSYPFGKTDIKRKISISFKFVKASYNKKKKYPPAPKQVYDIPSAVKNGKLTVEDL